MNPEEEHLALIDRIEHLEKELEKEKSRLKPVNGDGISHDVDQDDRFDRTPEEKTLTTSASIHALLLLSDSALPLGSFAYSSGLESFLAHRKYRLSQSTTSANDFQQFLHLSICSIAYTNLPYLLASYRNPDRLQELDNDLDASTPCTVARRASVAQGRALLGVWERSFRTTWTYDGDGRYGAAEALHNFSRAMMTTSESPVTCVNGHFAPLWGTTSRAMGLEAHQAAYIFLVNHAKAVLSAAVRASVMGPYQAQNVLAGADVQKLAEQCIHGVWTLEPEDAGQAVPVLDLWVGRHELLYSRIFNS